MQRGDSLPGRMSVQRSTRTRCHASGHAGAGKHGSGIDGCGHGDSGWLNFNHDWIFVAVQQKKPGKFAKCQIAIK
jgi:hypothetical protein